MAKSSRSSDPATAQALCRSNPPANTEHRSSSAFSGVVEQVVGPRDRVAQGVVACQSAPRARPAAGTADRADHAPRWRSSTPCVRPPTRWPTGCRRGDGRCPPRLWPRRVGPSENRCATLRARSTNNATAAESLPASTSSEGTTHNCSSATPSPSRLVATIRTVADRARIASTRSAAASRTCSQLSNTNNRTRPSNAAARLSATLLPGCWVMPSTAATASGTAAGSATAAKSKNQTPSGNSSASRAATSGASRVLPTPPTPVRVTNRC